MISFPFSSFFLFCLWSINRAHSVLLFQSVSDSQSLRPLAPGARAASPRKNVVCVVENALSAFSTTHTTSGERRRCEQAIVMGIRHALRTRHCLSVLGMVIISQRRYPDYHPFGVRTVEGM